jgi:chorismate synthase
MSIQAIKGVEIGLGTEAARRPGSRVMDPIAHDPDHPADDRRFGFRRPSNNAGGIEGGTSNGEPIVVRAAKKPISTLAARGPSINMATKQPHPASYERSDVCAVPAASVIVENVVAFEIAGALLDRYVGASLASLRASMEAIHTLSRQHLSENWAPKA